MRKDSAKLTELMTLLVFAVFALCLMWLLLTGAGVYQRLTQSGEESYESRVQSQYLATRLRQSQKVEVASFGEGDALVLGEQLEGEDYVTWVYLYDGYLRELFARKSSTVDPEDGERVLPMKTLVLSLDGHMLTIRTDTGTQYLYIRTGKEVPK